MAQQLAPVAGRREPLLRGEILRVGWSRCRSAAGPASGRATGLSDLDRRMWIVGLFDLDDLADERVERVAVLERRHAERR